jgi:hypothetical protein
MPPDGMREAFWICASVAFTKSLELVPRAAFSRKQPIQDNHDTRLKATVTQRSFHGAWLDVV